MRHSDDYNLYKIGMTNNSGEEKAQQLNNQTGVIGRPYKGVYEKELKKNAKFAEKIIHELATFK